jgi:ABC-type uncharacterized transport system permease subunit
MALIWLRVALGCYAVGLVYALLALTRASDAIGKVALHAAYLGMVFQFVSLTEGVWLSGQVTLASVHNAESLLAFLVMVGFMAVYGIYRTTSTGIIVFPVVFLLTFVSALGEQPFLVTSPGMRSGWLFAHIAMIFTGYAAMFLSFCASLLYLVQERNLKAKGSAGLLSRLPALEVIDDIGYRSLIFGFPFMTLGLAAGTVVAQTTFGHVDFFDPKILLSILMWLAYLIMLYTRWNAGWRGRRAAYLAAGAFASAVIAWAANYFSTIHRFVRS